MPARAQPGPLSAAPACLRSLPGDWHSTTHLLERVLALQSHTAQLIRVGFISWALPSPARPLPSSAHLPCPHPGPAQPSAAQQPVLGEPHGSASPGVCQHWGHSPHCSAPLKGPAAAEGQRGRSASTAAPGLELPMAGKWSSVTAQNSRSRLQEMPSTGCLCPLSASPSAQASTAQQPWAGDRGAWPEPVPAAAASSGLHPAGTETLPCSSPWTSLSPAEVSWPAGLKCPAAQPLLPTGP